MNTTYNDIPKDKIIRNYNRTDGNIIEVYYLDGTHNSYPKSDELIQRLDDRLDKQLKEFSSIKREKMFINKIRRNIILIVSSLSLSFLGILLLTILVSQGFMFLFLTLLGFLSFEGVNTDNKSKIDEIRKVRMFLESREYLKKLENSKSMSNSIEDNRKLPVMKVTANNLDSYTLEEIKDKRNEIIRYIELMQPELVNSEENNFELEEKPVVKEMKSPR